MRADINSGIYRMTFGVTSLVDGVGIIPMAMGLFAVIEVVRSVGQKSVAPVKQKLGLRDQLPTREDWWRSWGPIARGSGLGALFGALQGAGGGVATFISYAQEKRISKTPERFGNGTIKGIAAPEAVNNAGVGTAFIPTLTSGIPGDAVMALLLAALLIQGIQPGPQVISSHPDLFWGLIASFWIGNVILVILNIPLIGIWVRLLTIPHGLLFPAIILFTCIGVYSEGNNDFALYVLILFGVGGSLMHLVGLEPVPLLLGLILGQLVETNMRRALLLKRGDFTAFVTSPINAVALLKREKKTAALPESA